MTVTLERNITQDGWVEVLSDVTSLFVQIKTAGPVYVYIGADSPAGLDMPTAGICLTKDGLDHANLSGLDGRLFLTRQDSDLENLVLIGTFTLYSPEPT